MNSPWSTPAAAAVRAAVFTTFAQEGRPPSPAELVATLGHDRAEVDAALQELHDAHALVLTAAGDGVRMAHPFSAWPMGFVVRGSGDRLWWGGCAWDSFGIVAALGERLEIETTCPQTGTPLRYAAGPDEAPDAPGVVVRIPRPAGQWWDDVVATCTNIRAFASRDALHAWTHDHARAEPGYVVELDRLWRLALLWYGDRLDPAWAPRSRDDRQAMLDATGLTGSFWQLPS